MCCRLIEHFILHGPDPNAISAIIKQLQAPDRNNPQELDRAMVMFLRQVMEHKDRPHREVVLKEFVNS